MKFNLPKWREWRLKHQVCFLIIAESTSILIVVIALELINLHILIPRLQEISKHVALQQIQRQLNIQGQQYAKLAQTTIQRSTFRSINMNTLYDFSLSLSEIQQPCDCLLGQRDQYSWTSSYCFHFYGQQENFKVVTQVQKFTSIATQTLLMQDIDIDVLFLSLDSSLYYSRYPGKNLTGYDPLDRPWYLQFLNQTHPILISKPYLTFGLHDYVFSVSTLLSDIGMITSEFHFHDIDYQTLNPMTKVSMIDNSGLIYFSSNQENIGKNLRQQGYSSENLSQITDSRFDQPGFSSTSLKDIFCLMKENQEVEIIGTNHLGLQDIFLILQYSPSIQIEEINQQLKVISIRLYMIFISYSIMYIAFRIVVILVYLFTFNNLMLIPLNDIIAHTQHKISKQFKSLKAKPNNKDTILGQFRNAYDKFVNQFTYRQKTKCMQLELTNLYFTQAYDSKYQRLLLFLRDSIYSNETVVWDNQDINDQVYEQFFDI